MFRYKIPILLGFSLLILNCSTNESIIHSERTFLVNHKNYTSIYNTVIQAWTRDPSLPRIDFDSCDINEIIVFYFSDEEYIKYSNFCPPIPMNNYNVGGCFENYSYQNCSEQCAYAFFARLKESNILQRSYPIIGIPVDWINSLPEDYKIRHLRYIITHELIHWLSYCTTHHREELQCGFNSDHYQPFLESHADGNHLDRRLWGENNSVLSKALEIPLYN